MDISDEESSCDTNISSSIQKQLQQTTSSSTKIILNEEDFNPTPNTFNSGTSSSSYQNKSIQQNREEDQHEYVQPTILCVLWHFGKLAAAYYNIQDSKLFVIPDIWDCHPQYNVMYSLFRLVQPFRVISINKTTDAFTAALISALTGTNCTNAIEQMPLELQLLSRKAHSFEICKRRVLSLCLPDSPEDASEKELSNYMQSLLDISQCTLMTHALGILLMYVDKNFEFLKQCIENKENMTPEHRAEQSEQHHPVFKYLSIDVVSLNNIVLIDDETYRALQIFSPKGHPSNFKKGRKQSDREGLSLFGLFKNCKTFLGSKKLREYFVHPTNDTKILEERYEVLAFFMKPINENVVKNIQDSLRYVKNANAILSKMINMTASHSQWRVFYETVHNAILISSVLSPFYKESRLFNEIKEATNISVHRICEAIEGIIDFELSQIQKRIKIKLGIDEELDKKKNIYNKMNMFITDIAQIELKKLPEYITECNVIYIPELGYLLGIKKWKDNLTEEEIDSLNMKLEFILDDTYYFRSAICKDLYDEIGDIHVLITSHEARIILRLAQFVEKYFSSLQKLLNLIAEIDCLQVMAKVAYDQGYIRPILTEDRTIEITKGRHPLVELNLTTYVPNDFKSNLDGSIIKIITGINASGKSVYLKQIAIICFMAHIGSYVPANFAKITLLHSIHTRIQTVETISSEMSAFFMDLKQIAQAMYTATFQSLVIIDEFAGTSELDGTALLAATINEWASSVICCPHIVISTHYSFLAHLLEPVQPFIQFQMMQHTMDAQKRLVFLYNIIDGQVETSCAIDVAKSENFPTELIRRMEELLQNFKEHHSMTHKSNERPLKLPLLQAKLLKSDSFLKYLQSLTDEEITIQNVLNKISELNL